MDRTGLNDMMSGMFSSKSQGNIGPVPVLFRIDLKVTCIANHLGLY